MLLARQAGEHGRRADPEAPAASDAEQPAAQDAGGEVLLGDRCVAARPALPELAQVGQDDLARAACRRSPRPAAGRGSPGRAARRSGPARRRAPRAAPPETSAGGAASSATTARSASGGRLGGGQPVGEVLAHERARARGRRRVEAQAAGRAGRAQQPVAALPRAQQLGAHARSACSARRCAGGAVVGHARVLYSNLDKLLTNP